MKPSSEGPQASLDLTHVLYDDDSLFSLALALVTLSPILLMAAYAALAVQTREILIITMWAGQFACEGLNYVVKHIIKEERPNLSVGSGYGFPSSHSQYMGYFWAFLICHLYSRHRFSTTGSWVLDQAWRLLVYLAISGWAIAVAFSRYYLRYHEPHQILWGFGIGASGVYRPASPSPVPFPFPLFHELTPSIMVSLSFFLLSLPILSLAGSHSSWSIRRRHQAKHALKARNTDYTLEDHYSGQDFLDQWNFFDRADPTHGNVDYQSKADAVKKGLAYVQDDGTAVLRVDNTTHLSPGQNRASVRISSKKKYNGGLFIADFFTMPHGCSLWPAYWSVGPNWPSGGEIDILEGRNTQSKNQMTLHTSHGCSVVKDAVSKIVSSTVGNLQCASSGNDNTGCGFHDADERSYGHNFNINGGGVYAHLWNSKGITVWFFSRSEIPEDITSKNPNPDKWGTPSAFWAADSCSMDHFSDHSLVIDTTLCGDLAGNTFSGDGCPGSCSAFIQDPNNFHTARWKLNYISVYQSS
ncbi:hypothetical protein D9758_007777 [Tetrapyrgos nigripes]|uniref:GH16 domain-containing protein n=1 Tax=Tetrapyrgos nigripes TaxID=182062 RepID=A0A8H5CYA4_9AGAR|nr:hypothetical protein D9758_007777 [Tetrapyrgos nigripes]